MNRPAAGAAGAPGGTDLTPVPSGDDPVSAAIAVLMLPLALWELLKSLVAGAGAIARWATHPRAESAPAPARPPRELPTTRVVVTTCERHRRFRDRFVWVGIGAALGLAALWLGAVLETRRAMGTENVGLATALLLGAVFASVLVPLAFSVWYSFAGPVIVDRVTESGVVLDRVRQAYLDATGPAPDAEAPGAGAVNRYKRRR
ncbi:hypothetical protein R5W23_005630 [Gemmata sp. JC673]|uniref:Uncharacterized protein n=1 Tax=Gemmata algarum TaxID=2975278 RepID=A0ABU5EVM0_9BACT|nr:hypothetical protein [Gemmata algarum]MDY3558512.1 hypothetical protein [Gemmata algarum]